MMIKRSLALALPIALAFGCNDNKTGDTSPTTSAPIAETAAPAKAPVVTSAEPHHGEHPHMMRGKGVSMMLFHAASDLTDLKETQKATLEKIQAELKAGGSREAMKDLHTDLVAQVKAGKIDATKLEPKLAAVDKAAQDHLDKEAEALKELHDALDPAQRKALVASLRAKQAEHEKEGKEHRGAGDKAEDWAKHKLDHVTKELGLDDAQQKTVEGLLAKAPHPTAAEMDAHREEMKKRTDALLTAFEADTFDAKKVDLSPMPGKKAREPIEHEIQFLSQLLPVLKPEQRDKLAAFLEKPHSRPSAAAPADEEDPSFGLLWEDNPGH